MICAGCSKLSLLNTMKTCSRCQGAVYINLGVLCSQCSDKDKTCAICLKKINNSSNDRFKYGGCGACRK